MRKLVNYDKIIDQSKAIALADMIGDQKNERRSLQSQLDKKQETLPILRHHKK